MASGVASRSIDSMQDCHTRPSRPARRHSDMPRATRRTKLENTLSSSSDGEEHGMSRLNPRRRSAENEDRPHVLSYLDQDSPDSTAETLAHPLQDATPQQDDFRAHSSPISADSSMMSGGSEQCWISGTSCVDGRNFGSPASSVDDDIVSTTFIQDATNESSHHSQPKTEPMTCARKPQHKQPKDKESLYGTPEMPRGSANLPHLPPDALTPRVSHRGQGHVKYLPRAEKLPLTGYELLAARLSACSSSGDASRFRRHHGRPQSSSQPFSPGDGSSTIGSSGRSSPDMETLNLKPIYRRFEALNHRLLLHLQDELGELEEQLHRLDTADTQTRRLQNCILPASRRAGHMSGGELQWHKTDILGKIGFKLGQYNHALSSFKQTQTLPSPEFADVEAYRTYLARESPVAEIETRFLDPIGDLVSLARGGDERVRPSSGSSCSSSGASYERHRKGPYSPTALSDEAPTPRQGPSLAGFLPKATSVRFPFAGAPRGGAFLPTPSLSPASSVVGGCSRPGTAMREEEVEFKVDAVSEVQPNVRLIYLLLAVLVLLPLVLLRAVTGVLARLSVVLLLTTMTYVLGQVLAVAGRGDHCHPLLMLGSRDAAVYAGIYGAVMTGLAAYS